MVSSLAILLSCSVLVPTVLSASFPLTAISHYSSLAPCAVSHLDQELNSWPYDGCTSATPISAYGSCICAQRLHSVQFEISLNFGADAECSTTAVQPFLTAFCDKWGVDIAAADKIQASTTTTLAGSGPTSRATPGNTGNAALPTPTSGSDGDPSHGGLSDNKISLIAGVVGAAAAVVGAIIAWMAFQHQRKKRRNNAQSGHPMPGQTELQPTHMPTPYMSSSQLSPYHFNNQGASESHPGQVGYPWADRHPSWR